ncbi:MAG TPA: AIR synthase related protein, partial [Dehalococcoidia bacterium]|nr:AIR synthase related protein [Dehalococcoidia bacterium]
PASTIAENPVYHRESRRPAYLDELQAMDLAGLPEPADYGRVLLKLLASPNIASKEYVYRQYDHQVLTNTLVVPGAGDAAVLRVKGTSKAIALTTDGNSRYCYLEPYAGGAIAVAEAARNLVCTGAQPLAITNCLNFGNPEKPEIFYGMEQCVKGMADACQVLDTPVVSGNVSLYNETEGEPIYPTPVVGMVGLLDDADRRCTASFKEEGDMVVLLSAGDADSGLGGSEYLWLEHGLIAGRPSIDLEAEKRVQGYCIKAIRSRIIKSAHDCSEGGLAVALAECSILGGLGFQGDLPDDWLPENRRPEGRARWLDALLFGEGQSRIVLSLEATSLASLQKMARDHGVSLEVLGVVGGDRFVLKGLIDLPVGSLSDAWRNALQQALG